MNYFIIGFCGALTTWSTFIVDLFLGAENKAYKMVLINLVASLVVGFAAFKLGSFAK
jgi:CrcB protein